MKFAFGAYAYTLTPNGCFPGDSFLVNFTNYVKLYTFNLGFITLLRYFPNHSTFFNFTLNVIKGSQYSRSSGTFCLMIQLNPEKELAFIQLPTKLTKWVSWNCVGVLGRASNFLKNKTFLTKAGINRHKNIRPTVRGVAMNPVDHPHGGRAKTNSPEVTPWSRIAKFNN